VTPAYQPPPVQQPGVGSKVLSVIGFIVMVIVIAAIKIGCRRLLR
jgi:hypothetical protein